MTGSMWMGIAIASLVVIGAFIVFAKSADEEEKTAEESLEEALAGLRSMGAWEEPKKACREVFHEEEMSFLEKFYTKGNRVMDRAQKRAAAEKEKVKDRAMQEYLRDREQK